MAKTKMPVGKDKYVLLAEIKTDPEKVLNLLQNVSDSFENAGCEDCGTISLDVLNDIHDFLGFQRVEN
jgi:hypothetical protein